MSEAAAFLKQLDIFHGLDEAELARVAELCSVQTARAGEVIVAIGGAANEFYLVRQGTVEIDTQRADEPAGNGVRLTLGRGQMFGEMALVDRGMRSATAHALTDVVLYAVPCDKFLDLCEQCPRLGYHVMRNIAADLSFKLRQRNLI
jgi:CRP-like cAMP-binding protein